MLEWLPLILSPLNDVTTSPKDPPAFVAIKALPESQGRNLEYEQKVASIQAKLHPEISPFLTSLDKDKVWNVVKRVAQTQSHWSIVEVSDKDFRVEAIATTPLMKFKDDIVVVVRENLGQIQVDMRSKSRVGKSDLGANAYRIKVFFEQLSFALK